MKAFKCDGSDCQPFACVKACSNKIDGKAIPCTQNSDCDGLLNLCMTEGADQSTAAEAQKASNCQNLAILAFNFLVLLRALATDPELVGHIKAFLEDMDINPAGVVDFLQSLQPLGQMLADHWKAVTETAALLIDGVCENNQKKVHEYYEELVAFFLGRCARPAPLPAESAGPSWPKWAAVALCLAALACATSRQPKNKRLAVAGVGLLLAVPFFLLQLNVKDVTVVKLYSGLALGGLPPRPAAYATASWIAALPPLLWTAYAAWCNGNDSCPLPAEGSKWLPSSPVAAGFAVAGGTLVSWMAIMAVAFLVLGATTAAQRRRNKSRGRDGAECTFFSCLSLPWDAVEPGTYGFCGNVMAGVKADVRVTVPATNKHKLSLERLIVGGKNYLTLPACAQQCTPGGPIEATVAAASSGGKYALESDACVDCLIANTPATSLSLALPSPTVLRLFINVGLSVQMDLVSPAPAPGC